MTSKMASRLHRLQKLVESDLEALPDRSASPEPVSDDDGSGGISLLDPQAQREPSVATSRQAVKPEPHVPAVSQENRERRFIWIEGAASSYNLGAAPKLSHLSSIKLPPSKLCKGDLSTAGQDFTPITALSKFPYKFCNRSNLQEIASAFFDAGKFWAREWDLYYVWDIDNYSAKPLVLVLEHQVEQLLSEINATLKLQLSITDSQREEGLVGRFPDHPRCLPRFLGRSRSREDFDDMVSSAPMASFRAPNERAAPLPEGRTLAAFKKLMEDMWDIQKNKSKAMKEKKKQERIVKQKSLNEQFKQAQRYLGLRGSAQPATPIPSDPLLPAPFPFDQSVVFVCVDVESYEKAHNKITEVGIASLDVTHLKGVPPGTDGENWRQKIHAQHFRIREYSHLVNHEYVSGCPDRFEFGRSEFVALKDAAVRVGACFKPPFCETQSSDGSFATIMEALNIGEQRNVVFLGHDTQTDIKYLQQLGYDPMKLPNMVEVQDTATMYRTWRREPQVTKLGRILSDFNIAGWNLHNAGNDAVYTLQAFLGICTREATLRGSAELHSTREGDKAARLAVLTSEAKQRAEDEAEGWSDTEL